MDDTLLDVFVNVKPAEGVIEATEKALEEAAKRMRDKFVTVSNASLAAAQQAAAAARQVQNSFGGGGGGSGGSGGSGGGGGSGPGGRPQRAGVAAEFEQAKRQAEDLLEQTTRMRDVISTIRVSSLTGEYKTIESLTERIALNVSRQRKDNDLAGVRQSLTDLRELELRIRQLQTTSVVTADLRARFSAESNSGAQAIIDERLRSRLAQSQIRGLPSGELRTQILEASNLVQRLEADVKRLQQGFDGTQDSVDRLAIAIQRFQEGSEALGNLQSQAKAAGPSFNTLTNNAYQLGQAVEDFAVGFSLNGLAGGIRGAANNVAFLLNDMSRIPGVQKAIGENFARYLPVIAGVGSALAITVLPPLVEWLESLNDIDQKFKDIENSVNEITLDRGIEDQINRSTESVREFARNAESVSSIAQKVLAIRSEVVTLQSEIVGSVNAFAGQEVFQGFTKGIDEFQKKLDAVKTSLSGQRALAANEVPALLRGFVPEVEGLQSAIGRVSDALREVRAQGAVGVVNTDALKEASDSLRALREFAVQAKDPSTDLFKALDLSDDVAENLEKNVGTLAGAIEDLTNKSREAERAQQDMADAIIFSQAAVRRLVDDSRLELEALQGLVPESATFLRQIQRAAEASAKLQESIRDLSDKGLIPKELGDAAIANEKEAASLANRISLTDRLNSVKEKLKSSEERIAALSESQLKDQKSQLITIEQISQAIQSSALSRFDREEADRKKLNDSIKDEVLERQKLIDEMSVLREAYQNESNPESIRRLSKIPADRFSVDPPGFSKDRDLAKSWLEPLIRDMIAKQSETSSEVRKKDMSPRAQ